jgi:hydrogenase maturation protein HypF
MIGAMSRANIRAPVSNAIHRAAQRRCWRVYGRVQGVGFRPFIHRLANSHGLTGFVGNDGEGVVIEAQGEVDELERFAGAIRSDKPRLAIVCDISTALVPLKIAEDGFTIDQSRTTAFPRAQVAPDLAACPDCLRELRDPHDRRRFGYPLINCTACGPRFSIVRAVPYDRHRTTMAAFVMCEDCRREYREPTDRRFHAQPTACKTCGPKVTLVSSGGLPIDGNPIEQTADRLMCGQIIAIKGIGGFHLAVCADNNSAVERLRRIKHRPHKPFALMVADIAQARRIVKLSDRAAELLASPVAPIVLAPRCAGARIAAGVAPDNHRLGVMVAYTPLHHLIFDALRGRSTALVMTSANDSDEPLIFTHEDAVAHLGEFCDAILWHERPIQRPIDDSVVLDHGERDPIVIRRSRGFVPTPLALPEPCDSAGICLGGDLKNVVAVARGGEVILSQHLGDLQRARTYANCNRTIHDLLDLLQTEPKWIAHDMHPGYASTRLAGELARAMKIPRIPVQHHHAHAAAVLAEHGTNEPALAVVCDGTGYGTDGTIWGGELLMIDRQIFRRLGNLRPMLLPGGDAAARQTWRCAMALLLNAFGENFTNLPIVSQIAGVEQTGFIAQMLLTKTNCFTSTAAGRVFDGVAALLGLASENEFESQAPMALESAAAMRDEPPPSSTPLYEIRNYGVITIDFSPLVRELVARLAVGSPVNELAWLFHDQFAAAWEAAVLSASAATGLKTVALSGGVMCNQIIDRLLTDRLTQDGFRVLRPVSVPPNDGGLALGQATVAAWCVANSMR